VGLVTPYPPGIPLLIPGEVFNKKIVDYLVFAREFAKECPGFETDIHGLVELEDENGKSATTRTAWQSPQPSRRPRAAARPVPNRRPSLL
jgi:arginine/lysine/ornithine decarboxylase